MPLGIRDIKFLFDSETVSEEALRKFIDACSPTASGSPGKNNVDAEALKAAKEMLGEAGLAEPAPLTLALLNALAKHKKNNDRNLLNTIIAHPSRDESTYTAVLGNAMVNAECLIAIAESTELEDNLHTITEHSKRDESTDTTVVGKQFTKTEDLKTIAGRTKEVENLKTIIKHSKCDEAVYKAVLGNAIVNAECLMAIAKSTQLKDNLHTITEHSKHDESTDTIVVSNQITKTEDLKTIAGRTKEVENLKTIIKHPKCDEDVYKAVLGNAIVNAECLIEIAERTKSEENLHTILQHPKYDEKTHDGVVLANEKIKAEDLVTIAKRVTNPDELTKIATLPNADPEVLDAIISNPNHDEATLNAVATHNHSVVSPNSGRDTAILDSSKFRGISQKSLAALASRSTDHEQLGKIVTHPNHDKEVLMLSIANPSATPTTVATAMRSSCVDKEVLDAIAAGPHARAPEVAKVDDVAIFYAEFKAAATPDKRTELLHKFHAESKAKGTVGSWPVEIQREVASAVIPQSDKSLRAQFTDPVALREAVNTVLAKVGI